MLKFVILQKVSMAKTLPKTKLTQKQYDELVMDLRGKVFVLCMNIEVLLDKNGVIWDNGIAILKETRYNMGIVTLYLHALEQLGKLVMITDYCKNTFDGTYYDLDSIKTDFYDHDKKLDVALANLPNECKDIFVNPNPSLSIDIRLRLLHSDIDNKGNVLYPDEVDVDKIKKAFEIFKTKQFSY